MVKFYKNIEQKYVNFNYRKMEGNDPNLDLITYATFLRHVNRGQSKGGHKGDILFH